MKRWLKRIAIFVSICTLLGILVSLFERLSGKLGRGQNHRPCGVYERAFKRTIDFSVVILALLIIWPIMLIIAMAIRVKLGGPVIFKQERPGLNEKVFTMYKFRTMTDARDEDGNLLPDELRLTSFGEFLRAYSLDELPELINILKGDMSIIGPRPLLIQYLPYYTEKEKRRHDVRPGLTGYAQVNGRNLVSWDERLAMDVEYVDHITFVRDAKILLKTVKIVLCSEGVASNSYDVESSLDEERKGKAYNSNESVD